MFRKFYVMKISWTSYMIDVLSVLKRKRPAPTQQLETDSLAWMSTVLMSSFIGRKIIYFMLQEINYSLIHGKKIVSNQIRMNIN